jgi:hypothetical protein
LVDFGPLGHVNTMKTPIVAALLLASLAFAGTALACPVDDAVAAAGAIASCLETIPGADGNNEHVVVTLPVDVIDQHPVCLN